MWLWWFLQHDVKLDVTKASRVLHDHVVIIIMCQQFIKHLSMFQSFMNSS